jgi:hypothetical protein
MTQFLTFHFSNTYENHFSQVNEVLRRLNQYNLRINPDKCTWATVLVHLLGYEITPLGYSVAPEKVVSIDNWSYPTTGKQMQKDLVFFNFFRDVIPLYSRLSQPLDRLRYVPDFRSVWTFTHAKSYEQLRAALHSRTILSFPDFTLPFKVGTDASDRGLGAVLYQDGPTGPLYIAFAARSLTDAQ